MNAYYKKYQDLAGGLVDMALGFLFTQAKNFIVSKQKRQIYREYHDWTGRTITKKQISSQFYDLKRRGYIQIEEVAGQKSIRLTNRAKIKLVEKIAEKYKEERKYRFVSFDIPENMHHRRDCFRRVIKRMGFRQIQQSLWVINKNVGELVELAAKEYGVEDYVVYIVGESANIENFIRGELDNKSAV